ncbi:VWA domain-containing protein [Candidatus Bathyarchaeota archaeon]|nr:VWA domain-containing protein [Candidatus Bathyarchaeota archaeon]
MPGSKSSAPPPILLTQPTQTESAAMPTESSPARKSFFGSVKDKIRGRSKEASAPPVPQKDRRARSISGADDQPPAYSDVVNAPSGRGAGRTAREPSPAPSIASITTPEDPYAFLSTFDTIFIIDDSGSMAGRSWRETKDALRSITPICAAHDSDGIDLYFLNHKSRQLADPASGKPATGYWGLKDAAAVEGLFGSVRPSGGTPTGTRLQHILKPYLQLLERNKDTIENIKPVNVIVITDGVPSDDVEGVLLLAAKKLDRLEAPPYQVGVQFFQVGNEMGAREALQDLDDGLGELVDGGVRDMVDTVTWSETGGGARILTGESILKVVLGAVIRRLDRRDVGGGRGR